MKYAGLAVAVFFARLLTSAIAFPAGDGDLAWQEWLGRQILVTHAIPRALGPESFAAVGAAWTPQEWAFSIGVALAKQGGEAGWVAFATIVATLCALALVLVARTCVTLGAAPVWTALATALAGVSILQSYGVRAQVAAWPLVAALLWLLQHRGRRVWWIVPLAAVWSNLHASVLLAPIVTALVAAGTWLDEGRVVTPEVRRLVLVAVAALAATCLNPFGVGLPLYALHLFGNGTLRSLINEWQPTRIDDPSFAVGGLVLLVCGAVAGLSSQTPWRHVFVIWAFAFLMIGAGRNIGIFGIAAAPYVAAALTARVRGSFPRSGESRPEAARERVVGTIVLPAVSLALVVVVVIGLLQKPELRPDPGIDHVRTALAGRTQRRLFCEDFAWCSFFIAGGTGDFLDGRADPFPDAVWRDYGKILRLSPGWEETLAARRIDAVLAHRDGALAQALHLRGGWRSVYADETYALFLQTLPPARARGPVASASRPVASEAGATARGGRDPKRQDDAFL